MDTVIMVKRLGLLIESLRCDAGMSIANLAAKAYTRPAYITQLEEGQLPDVSVALIADIAEALGITLSDLFADLDEFQNEDELAELSTRHRDKEIGYICYPPVVDRYPVTSLMQFMLYLPLFNPEDLIDMLLRIDGRFGDYEKYVLELIRLRMFFIPHTPAKGYADSCLRHLNRDHFLTRDFGQNYIFTYLLKEHEAYHEKILQFAERMGVNPAMR